MLSEIHFDLNSVQFCSDSLKERLKQTMLNQEFVFMGQVFELHRLHKIQMAMTEDIKQRGLDDYNSHAGVNSGPVKLNDQVKHSLSGLQVSSPRFKQKSLDLQLSADEFIRQSVNDLSGKDALTGLPIESNNSFKYNVVFDLNRPLSTGEETEKSIEHRFWMGKRTCGRLPDIIDLEDPKSIYSNKNLEIGNPSDLATPNSCLKDKHKLGRSTLADRHNLQIISKSRARHVSHGTTLSRPFNDVGQTSQRQTLGKTDFSDASKSVTCGTMKFDLNTVQLGDQSYFSNNYSGVVNPISTAFSTVVSSVSRTSWRESNVSSRPEILDVHVQGDVKPDTAGANISSSGKPEGRSGGQIVLIDLDSDSHDELCNNEDPKIESVGSTSKLSNGLSCEIGIDEAVGEEEIINRDLNPLKLSNWGQISMVDSNFSSESPNSSSVRWITDGKKVEVDETVQTAAELLVQLSLHERASYLPVLEKSNSRVSRRKEQDRPQCSSGSYEELMLNAEECGPDDYCVSSNAFGVEVPEKKDNRYKLKRGTRMKDFQKDILSSVSTLSRHEIRQDIKIFEGVLKSREYKKMLAKMGDEDNWCRPTRNKRSRISRR